MERCRNCKWWGEPFGDDQLLRVCLKVGDGQGENQSPDHRLDLVRARDFEEYCAWLTTAADYGCVLWEANA